jgi:hypothetical protein
VEGDGASGGGYAGIVQGAVKLRLVFQQSLQGCGLLDRNLDMRRAGCGPADLDLNHAQFCGVQAQRHLLAAVRGLSQRQQSRRDLCSRRGWGRWSHRRCTDRSGGRPGRLRSKPGYRDC